MKKIASFIVLFLMVSSSAFAYDTTVETEEVPVDNEISNIMYKVTYHIEEKGWYLLPYEHSIAHVSIENGNHMNFYNAQRHKYAFSPFSKKYIRCVKNRHSNPLMCDLEQIYGIDEDQLEGLPPSILFGEYLDYTSIGATWYYFEGPIDVQFTWHPSMLLFDSNRPEMRLSQAKLKRGWNLISFPPHVNHGDLSISSECEFNRMAVFDARDQDWELVDLNRYPRDELIEELTEGDEDLDGLAFAIDVDNDCRFIDHVPTPPPLPQ